MGAKYSLAGASLLLVLAPVLSSCATAARLLPPGFVVQEELAGDQPVNPVIQEIIDDQDAAGAGDYPILAKQPVERPQGLSPAEKSLLERDLMDARAALEAGISEDKAAAEAERQQALDKRIADIEAALERDRRAAERERQ